MKTFIESGTIFADSCWYRLTVVMVLDIIKSVSKTKVILWSYIMAVHTR